jgi:hypothetical protein
MTLKPLSSLITTSQMDPSSQTSKPPIESGVLTLSLSVQQAALVKMQDESISPLQRTTMIEDGVSSLVRLEGKYNKDFELMSYTIAGKPSLENLMKAYKLVQTGMIPLPLSELDQRLTAMAMVLTIPQSFGAKQLATKREILANKLADYPADIVIRAIGYIERNVKFWPSLAEFINDADIAWMTKPRKIMSDELHKCIARHHQIS